MDEKCIFIIIFAVRVHNVFALCLCERGQRNVCGNFFVCHVAVERSWVGENKASQCRQIFNS